MSAWTDQTDLQVQVQRLWDRGLLLRSLMSGTEVGDADSRLVFPYRLRLKRPASADLVERFEDVRTWIAGLNAADRIRIVRRRVNHRVLGANDVPAEAWLDSLDDALTVVGRRREAALFEEVLAETRRRRPPLLTWVGKRPLVALDHATVWEKLLDFIDWIEANVGPGIYLRQVDLPGIDTKFVETHRAVLSELIDHGLPAAVIEPGATGARGFERRLGFRTKPNLVRFRVLDPGRSVLAAGGLPPTQDVSLDSETFAILDPAVSRVYVVENEINFLAFPECADAMVLWGGGFGTERFASAAWLERRRVLYWGDIDTHGFAILDEVRRRFSHVESFLMDGRTLLDHRQFWGCESKPEIRDLPRLTTQEAQLYDDLRCDRHGHNVRLEQERIGYDRLVQALDHHRLWPGQREPTD